MHAKYGARLGDALSGGRDGGLYRLSPGLLADGRQVTGIGGVMPVYDVRLKERRHALLASMAGFEAHRAMLEDAE